MKSFFKYLSLIIMQIIVALISVPLVLSMLNHGPLSNSITGADSVALANTFMVFVTFIVVVGTVVITIAGIVYSNWFSKQKVAVIRENMSEVIDALLEEKDLKDEVLLEVLKQPKIKNLIDMHITELASGIRNDFISETKDISSSLDTKLVVFENKIIDTLNKRINNVEAADTLNKIFGDKK